MKMKIYHYMENTTYPVFGFYFSNAQIYFLALSIEDRKGLIPFDSTIIDIIDHSFAGKWIYHDHGFYHWALIEYNLLEDLISFKKDSFSRFLEIIESEWLI